MAEYGREYTCVCGFGVIVCLVVICCGQMFSSKRVDGRKVNSDGDGPDESIKAEADPPTVTADPLQEKIKCNYGIH
ncbi:hypothetical protein T4D_15164 [Trichinella pseudospiralis]|uniref:Uncharacterized protein n=1 Tax=Trichinella pseudospiralis TaxID=6337 RepID=A0A0V1FPK5_TRIPS|nr:hypothetical protein T4D_15164 [Trichinella pseudospiralis]